MATDGPSIKAVKLLASSALRACSGMAAPLFPEHALHAERRLPLYPT